MSAGGSIARLQPRRCIRALMILAPEFIRGERGKARLLLLDPPDWKSGVRMIISINITVLKYGGLEAICTHHGDNVSGRD